MTFEDRLRLLKLCRLLASDQDGERATAASMANRLAERLGGWEAVLTHYTKQEEASSSRPWANGDDPYWAEATRRAKEQAAAQEAERQREWANWRKRQEQQTAEEADARARAHSANEDLNAAYNAYTQSGPQYQFDHAVWYNQAQYYMTEDQKAAYRAAAEQWTKDGISQADLFDIIQNRINEFNRKR